MEDCKQKIEKQKKEIGILRTKLLFMEIDAAKLATETLKTSNKLR